MIEVYNFSKSYKNSFSIENINFSVKPGEITALLGVNGSGKTTVIKAICGFHYPDNGNIFVSDNSSNEAAKIDVSENPEHAMNFIGYVPEISQLPSEMYVFSFLNYAAEVHNLLGKEKEAAIQKVINDCQLQSVLNKKIKQISKGYKQRVSFAQALIHNPANLILDEPISGLDPAQIVQMRKLIKKLSETKSILISTHILQEVNSLCKKIVVITDGKQLAWGTESEVLKATKSNSIEELMIKSQNQE